MEILAAILIVGVLLSVALFYTGQYFQYARQQSDKQTLATLNDALSRYKTQGGNVTGLTAGSSISALFTRMQTAVTWGGLGHQFLRKDFTYPARSLSAAGNGAQYNFYRANSYAEYTPSGSTPTSSMPYGGGVGYAANNSGTYGMTFATSTGHLAVKPAGGSVTIVNGGSMNLDSVASSITFWSCTGAADSTPSGIVTAIDIDGDAYYGYTALDVRGLTGLTTLFCYGNALTTLEVSGLTHLNSLYCYANPISSLSLAGCTSLSYLDINNTLLTSISLSGLNLQTFISTSTPLTALDFSGMTRLTSVDCSANNLDATALNNMYRSLNDRSIPIEGLSLAAGNITRAFNPGAGDETEDTSIATSKNWYTD